MAFYLLVGGIGALQAATLYEPAFAVVARRTGAVHARAGITAVTLWGGFASTVFIPLVQWLLDAGGWRGALMVLGAINIVLCASLYWTVIDPKADMKPNFPGEAGTVADGPSILSWAVRRPVFWALAVAFTIYAGLFSAFTFHLYPLLVERGLDPSTVVIAMALIGPAQVAGRVAIMILATAAPVKAIGSVVVLAFPLSLLLLLAQPLNIAIVGLLAILYGSANGIFTIVRGLAVPEMLTPHAYGAINGALAAPSLVVRALAPVGAALLWASAGSYDPVVLALLLGASLLAVSFWTAALLSSHGRDRGPRPL